MLTDSSDDEGGVLQDAQLTINEHYAKAFEYRKEREELAKLKEKYGSSYGSSASSLSSTDSESAESEDEDGEELTATMDAAILRTLARIRRKDPGIYESAVDVFGEETEKVTQSASTTTKKSTELEKNKKTKKDKSKPLTLRQAALSTVLNPSRSPSPQAGPATHVEEQRKLRDETIAAFHGALPSPSKKRITREEEEEEEEDDLFIPREKTKDEREAEEEEYRAFLERQVGDLDLRELVSVDGDAENEADGEVGKEETKKKKKGKEGDGEEEEEGGQPRKSKSKSEKDQEFLMNYILNRGWIDRSSGHVPTYGEITSPLEQKRKERKTKKKEKAAEEGDDASKPKNSDEEDDEDDPALLSDTSFDSLASHFEASYNHRFEEPNAALIPSFPRSLPSLVRRADTTRKEARERRKKRKEEEMERKREEVRRMKALKQREVRRMLEKITLEGGLEKGQGKEEVMRELEEDFEGEWDAERHDERMRGLFAEEEQGGEGEGEDEDEDGKPVWEDDIDMGGILVSEDDAFPVKSKRELKKEKKKKEKKEKNKKNKKKGEEEGDEGGGVDVDFMDADVEREEEEWDGTEEMRKRKLDEYMDEIYGLEFNDLVAGQPTRFKYVPVPTQTYSLTPVEILLATDKELNEYVSVKKYAPYRQEKDRSRWDGKEKEKLREFKEKVGERVGGFAMGGQGGGEKVKKRKGKKERMKMKAAAGAEVDGEEEEIEEKTGEKRKRQDEKEVGKEEVGEVKKKKRQRHRIKGGGES